MKNSEKQSKLEEKGWAFSVLMTNGNRIAKKGQRTVIAASWTALFAKL